MSIVRTFKDYILEYRPGFGPQGKPWEFVHKDYDGPGDNRVGYAETRREAVKLIEELIEELEEESR